MAHFFESGNFSFGEGWRGGVAATRDAKSGHAEFGGECEFALADVEGEEGGGFEGEGGGDVKDVEGAGAESAGLRARELPGAVKDGGGYGSDLDEAGPYVVCKQIEDALFVGGLHLSAKNGEIQRIDELEFAEVRADETRIQPAHCRQGCGSVDVRDVERKEKAGVRVNDQ